MFNLLISGFSLLLIVFMYQQSFVYQGVEQVYLGLYKGIAEECVVSVQLGASVEPKFHVPTARTLFQKYVDANMGLYTKIYSCNVKGATSGTFVSEIIVTLSAKTSDFQTFERDAVFAIRRNY